VRRVASLVVLALAVLSCSNTAVQHAERLVSNRHNPAYRKEKGR